VSRIGFARALAEQIGRALDYTSLRGDGRRRPRAQRGIAAAAIETSGLAHH